MRYLVNSESSSCSNSPLRYMTRGIYAGREEGEKDVKELALETRLVGAKQTKNQTKITSNKQQV